MAAKPESFSERAAAAIADRRLITAVQRAVSRHDTGRAKMMPELGDPLAVRTLAAEIKDHTLANLDTYLRQLADAVRARGGHIHFAETAQQARDIIQSIAQDANAGTIVKAKSMTTEEIGLTGFLEKAGFEVVETDLGEYIVQIDEDRPSHIVAPVIHKTKEQIAEIFHRKLGIPYTEDPREMAMAARRRLRDRFYHADMGIIGCNLAVAETGTVCIVTNEGNGRYCANRPRVLVSLMGFEKLIPRTADLALFLKLLPKSATGQRMSCYTSLVSGPRVAGETDGPEQFHLVVLDAGRSKILAGQYRETLRCIRCGACLNTCPVYRNVGGHTYDCVYPGPIGKLITPLLTDLAANKDLPQASSLCGACYDVCPVRIDIPEMLIRMRNDLRKAGQFPLTQRIAMKFWRIGMSSKFLYKIGSRFYHKVFDAGAVDGFRSKLPGQLSQWTRHRDMPAMADKPFHVIWDRIKDEAIEPGPRRTKSTSNGTNER